MRMIKLGLVLCMGLLLAPAWAQAEVSRLCAKPTSVHAFHVAAEWDRSPAVYRRSEAAKIVVTVTRPAHEDPAGGGVPIDPPQSLPEAGVSVWSSVVTTRWPWPYGAGVTDANGQVRLRMPMKDGKPGTYDVSHYVEKWTNQGGCPDIQEWGQLYESPGVVIKP
jgi:hypothetical protein